MCVCYHFTFSTATEITTLIVHEEKFRTSSGKFKHVKTSTGHFEPFYSVNLHFLKISSGHPWAFQRGMSNEISSNYNVEETLLVGK